MKINHMICPNCGHDFFVDCAYATCDACQTFFYAGESKTSQQGQWEYQRYEDGRPRLLAPKVFVKTGG